MVTLEEVKSALKALGPFEVVQGDVIKRLCPHSSVVVNSTGAWAVSNGDSRSAHKVRMQINILNKFTEE